MKAVLKQPPKMVARLNKVKEYPQLEDLEITPSAEEQNFKSNKYGYDNVKVRAVKGEELNIVPTMETQEYKGLYEKVNVNAIESEEMTITPTTTEQIKEGLYNKVTVAGDNNLIADNIKDGVSIFGVVGTAKTTNLKITSGNYLFYNGARADYINEICKLCENITWASYMFYSCPLGELDLNNLDLSSLEYASNMFNYANTIEKIAVKNANNIKEMDYMFANSSFKEIDLSELDFSKVINIRYAFNSCWSLVTLKTFKNLGKGFTNKSNNYRNYVHDMSTCGNITYESLIDLITNGLYDLNLTYNVANGGTLYTQKLVLGSTNMAKLTSEEIAIATNKGWTVS